MNERMMACITCDKVFKGTGEFNEHCPYCDSEAVVPHDYYSTEKKIEDFEEGDTIKVISGEYRILQPEPAIPDTWYVLEIHSPTAKPILREKSWILAGTII